MTKKEKEDFQELKAKYDELKAKYNEDFERLVSEKADAYDENDVLKSKLAQKENEVRGLKSDVAALRQTIGGYITVVGKQKKEITELKGKCEMLQKYLSDATAQNADLIDKKNEILKTSQKTDKENDELKREKEEAKRVSNFYKANYEHFLSLPWWKRIFAK